MEQHGAHECEAAHGCRRLTLENAMSQVLGPTYPGRAACRVDDSRLDPMRPARLPRSGLDRKRRSRETLLSGLTMLCSSRAGGLSLAPTCGRGVWICPMDLGRFLVQLRRDGRVHVGQIEEMSTVHAVAVLRDLHREACFAGPSGLPAFEPDAASWAARWLHAACQCFVHRDFGVAEIERRLGRACPSSPTSSAVHFSVDLTMRYLPDLWTMVRGVAVGDPLLVALRSAGREWPLSSVGMGDLGRIDIDPLLQNVGLRVLYVDRVLGARDASRLEDERVRRAIAAAYGDARELARDASVSFDSAPTAADPR